MTDITNDGQNPLTDAEWNARLEQLDLDTLHDLNRLICDRIDYLHAQEISDDMRKFRVGQNVSFIDKQGNSQYCTVIKHNRKTISVLSPDGKKWNVSPSLLIPETEAAPEQKTSPITHLKLPPTTAKPVSADRLTWVASQFDFPGVVNSENGDLPYQPQGLVWMDAEGFVRNLSALEPEDAKNPLAIQASFEQAMDHPDFGQTEKPNTIRTDNQHIIDALSPLYPNIKLIKGETPEVDEVLLSLTENMNATQTVSLYSELEIPGKQVAAFFKSTANLYRKGPWRKITNANALIGISIKALGVQEAVLVTIGHEGLHFGMVLFESLKDYEAYALLAQLMDVSRMPETPTHRALTFVPAKDIEPNQRKDFMENGWEIASPDAYPDLCLLCNGGIIAAPCKHDLEILTAVSNAVVALIDDSTLIKKAMSSGAAFSTTKTVTSGNKAVDVTLFFPVLPPGNTEKTLNPAEKISLLSQLPEHIAEKQYHELTTTLEDAFCKSPECAQLDEPGGAAELIMLFSFNYMGCPVTQLAPGELEDILYDIIPRKVMIDVTEADSIVDDCIAFFSFLTRAYELPHAKECLKMLTEGDKNGGKNGDKVKQRLRHAMSDTSKFGIGKSAILGTDLPLPDLYDMPDMPAGGLPKALTAKEKKKRKDKRKNSRKARKKVKR